MTHCSCQLSPVLMVRALKANKFEEAVRFGLMDCVECGICSYVCPARLKLVQRFKVGKQLLREAKQKEAAKAAAQGGK